MKKLFMFLAVAGLATFGASCSKSDDSPAPVEAKELKLSATPNGTVDFGTEITFGVYSGTEKINDADIKADGVVVKNSKWKADKAGTFKFKATKKDHKDSNEVIITVKDAPEVPSSNFIKVGNNVISLKGAAFSYFSKGGKLFTQTLEDGTIVAPFRISMFTTDIVETIQAADYDNSGVYVVYVVQDPKSTTITLPWTANAEILPISYDVTIDQTKSGADAETKFTNLVMSEPNKDTARGTMALKVDGNTETGDVLLSDYNGPFQAYFEVKLKDDARSTSSLKSAKTSVKVTNIDNLKR